MQTVYLGSSSIATVDLTRLRHLLPKAYNNPHAHTRGEGAALEIQQLRYFVHAARCSSFREAAEGLFVTRAALGKAISALEAELGQPLFDRSRDGVRPTSFGAAYLEQVEALVADFDRLSAAMKGDARVPVVRVCIPTSWLGYYASKVEACRAALDGRVEVAVESCTDAECVRRFTAGDAELIVTHLPLEGTYDQGLLLLRTPLYIAMSERNELAAKETLTADDLRSQEIFYYTCGFDQVFWVPTIDNGRSHFDNDLMHIYACVHRNEGILPTPLYTIPEFRQGIVCRPAPPGPHDTIETLGYIADAVRYDARLLEACLAVREALAAQ